MSNYKITKSGNGIPISEPMLLDDDDLRIIISALLSTRRYRGSVRADNLIRMMQYQLDHPDTHVMQTDSIPFS